MEKENRRPQEVEDDEEAGGSGMSKANRKYVLCFIWNLFRELVSQTPFKTHTKWELKLSRGLLLCDEPLVSPQIISVWSCTCCCDTWARLVWFAKTPAACCVRCNIWMNAVWNGGRCQRELMLYRTQRAWSRVWIGMKLYMVTYGSGTSEAIRGRFLRVHRKPSAESAAIKCKNAEMECFYFEKWKHFNSAGLF